MNFGSLEDNLDPEVVEWNSGFNLFGPFKLRTSAGFKTTTQLTRGRPRKDSTLILRPQYPLVLTEMWRLWVKSGHIFHFTHTEKALGSSVICCCCVKLGCQRTGPHMGNPIIKCLLTIMLFLQSGKQHILNIPT